MALFIVAIDSLAASMGPPGSASEIASPATIGARTTRDHSSSVNALFVVTACPSSEATCRHRPLSITTHHTAPSDRRSEESLTQPSRTGLTPEG